MTWTGNATPDGTKSVRNNRVPLQNQFAYIENTMQVDHFFDDANSDKDGHHQFSQMPKYEDGGTPADPPIATAMDGVYFVKEKTEAEAPDLQKPEPFHKTFDGTNNQVVQVGFRALAHFEVGSSPGFTVTPKYLHNCSVARTGVGLYRLTFATPLPTNNYIVSGTAQRDSSNSLMVAIRNGTKATRISTTFVDIQIASTSDSLRDPITCMIMVAGG